MCKTLSISLVIIAVITMAFYVFQHPSQPTASPSPTPAAEYPSSNDLYQTDFGGPNHSIYIDDAIKKILRDPSSYQFISATRWTQDVGRVWIKSVYLSGDLSR
jgi:hypothetical protein